MSDAAATSSYPRLTYLRIKNYRAPRDVELRDLTPLTVFIGPNGSGRSTVLDALAFLAEAVDGNLQQAWEKRNRFAGIRTRGSDGPIEFEVGISEVKTENTLVYHVEIDEQDGQIRLVDEWLKLGSQEDAKKILKARNLNSPIRFELTSEIESPTQPIEEENGPYKNGRILLDGKPSLMLGFAFAYNKSISQQTTPVFNLLKSYRYIHLTDDYLKGYSDAGPREKLSTSGENLPNVLYYLHTKHPEELARITAQLRRWVPGISDIVTEITSDERLLLRFKDAPFEKPLPAQYMSDGTMRLAALLTLLYEPNATGLLGIEEPENELHPRLLPRLAEELIKATETRQLLVATHSPFLLDALEPEQVWILHRGTNGYTQATRTADLPDVVAMVEEGSKLGYLWSRNFFDIGDPLAPLSSQSTQE